MALIEGVLLALFFWMFTPYTAVWYLLLFSLGALYLFFAVCYLPFYYVGLQMELRDDSMVYLTGVFIRKARYQQLAQISAVSVWDHPLSDWLKLSTLILYAPGSTLVIPLMDQQSAYAIMEQYKKKK